MYPAEGSLCRMPWWLSGEMVCMLLILPWVRIPAVTAFFSSFFGFFISFFGLVYSVTLSTSVVTVILGLMLKENINLYSQPTVS